MLRHLMTSWHWNTWIVKIWLSQERKKLWKWNKSIFLVSKVLFFRQTKQTKCSGQNFLGKMVELKKIKTCLWQLPKKKTSPPPRIYQTPSRISTIVQSPPINYFFIKLVPPPLHSKETGRHKQQNIVLYSKFFCTYWYMYIYLLCTCVELKDT